MEKIIEFLRKTKVEHSEVTDGTDLCLCDWDAALKEGAVDIIIATTNFTEKYSNNGLNNNVWCYFMSNYSRCAKGQAGSINLGGGAILQNNKFPPIVQLSGPCLLCRLSNSTKNALLQRRFLFYRCLLSGLEQCHGKLMLRLNCQYGQIM